MSLSELSVSAFIDDLASDSPAPGGGSAAALEAALGAALGVMVAKLTQGRKKYAEFAEHAAEIERKCDSLQSRLLGVMERDTDAFNKVSAAFALPKGTDEEKAWRSGAIQEALRGCTETPLELMELCDEGLDLIESMMGRCNDTCVSDLGVAALSLKAGVQGAWLNVCINIASLKDKAFADECRKKGESLLSRTIPVADRCYAEVLRLSGGA